LRGGNDHKNISILSRNALPESLIPPRYDSLYCRVLSGREEGERTSRGGKEGGGGGGKDCFIKQLRARFGRWFG
jgi:hypothetical protein